VQSAEEVRVPRDIERQIEALADLKMKVGELECLLGNRVDAAGLLRPEVKPPEEAPQGSGACGPLLRPR
jgi:hypothetical protein